VFTPIGGAIADRFSKRNLMVGLDAASALVVAVLIGLVASAQVAAPLGQMLYGLAFEAFKASLWVPLILATAFAALIAATARTLLAPANQATAWEVGPRPRLDWSPRDAL
jgi:nitrate/nitrite transporter NarK